MPVPFGFGVGDFAAVSALAWKLYKSTKEAPESFRNIHVELLSLHAVIKEAEETVFAYSLPSERQVRLKAVRDGIDGVLTDLDNLVEKYESLGHKTKAFVWTRMRWGSENIADIRARLNTNVSLLGTFICTSQLAVQQRLEKFASDRRRGNGEASIISVQTVDSLTNEQRNEWRLIRKELEEVGITIAAWETNRDFILKWIKRAVETGAFDEQPQSAPATKDDNSNSLCTNIQNKNEVPQTTGSLKLLVQFQVFAATSFATAFSSAAAASLPLLDYKKGEILDIFSRRSPVLLAAREDDTTGEIGWVWDRGWKECTRAEGTLKTYHQVRPDFQNDLGMTLHASENAIDLSDLSVNYGMDIDSLVFWSSRHKISKCLKISRN